MKTEQGYRLNLNDICYEDEDHLIMKKERGVTGDLSTPLFLTELGIESNKSGEGILWMFDDPRKAVGIVDTWIEKLESIKGQLLEE